MRFFDLDSPLMTVLGKIADLMILNMIALICCIPVITAGASFTALHYMALKMVRNEECYIIRGFFKSFKENFKQATAIWLLILVIIGIVAGDFYIIVKSGIEFHMVLRVIIMAAAVLIAFTAVYVFPVLAKFENTIKRTIKNAFIMSILQFPKTILMIIMLFVPYVMCAVSWNLIPIAFVFGLSVPAYFSAMLYNKFFKKLEDQILEENGPKQDGEEDEHIFSDELDERLVEENKA